MDIAIGRTALVNRDGSQNGKPSFNANKIIKSDRRKNKRDRRKSVRDGVFVTLSTKPDRRIIKDRRRNP